MTTGVAERPRKADRHGSRVDAAVSVCGRRPAAESENFKGGVASTSQQDADGSEETEYAFQHELTDDTWRNVASVDNRLKGAGSLILEAQNVLATDTGWRSHTPSMRQNISKWNCFIECFQAVRDLAVFSPHPCASREHERRMGVITPPLKVIMF